MITALQVRWQLKCDRITRAQAKKMKQGRPIELHGGQTVDICHQVVKKFYESATDLEDMKARTAGTAERVEVHDQAMLIEGFQYMRRNGFKTDGSLLDVGAGLGLRTKLLL